MATESHSLIGVVIYNGRLCEKHIGKDGAITYRPVPVEGEDVPDAFADTETIPDDWKPPTTDVLVSEGVSLTREQHVHRSCAVEAVLVKAMSPQMKRGGTETLDTRGNTALKELLQDLCHAMGGAWAEQADKIT